MAEYKSPHALHPSCLPESKQVALMELIGGTQEAVDDLLAGRTVIVTRDVAEAGHAALGEQMEDVSIIS